MKFERRNLQRLGAGSTFNEVSRKMVMGFSITAPQEHDERRAIGDTLRDMDVELDALRTKLAKLRAIKTGMMQELLSGRTRLV